MTTKELLAQLDALRVANGKTELANWKSSREKLEAAIAAEQPQSTSEDGQTEDETDPTMPMGENGNSLVDPIDEPKTEEPAPSDLSDVEGQTQTEAAEPLIPRGAIGAMSIELLTASDEPYESIVGKIVARYPTAKTTARSLASVAMDLRRDGVDVPSRRKPAKAKAEKPAKTEEAPAGE